MKILFFNTGKAYLPELNAYKKYFGRHGYVCEESRNISRDSWADFPIHWYMMGTDFQVNFSTRPQLLIHEYHSASTGKTAKIKNFLKKSKLFTRTPDARVYLSHFLEQYFQFGDGVRGFYRDMGYYENTNLEEQIVEKEFDFIYVGSMGAKRKLEPLLDYFKFKNQDFSICMLGSASEDLVEKYSCSNIVFPGRVAYDTVGEYLSKSKCAINYIPNDFPYNLQTSTKFIEYVGLGMNVASTEYSWVSNFSQENHLSPYFFKQDMSDFCPRKALDNITGKGKISNYQWDTILDNSGLLKFFKENGC